MFCENAKGKIDRARIAFAVKSNPHAELLKVFAGLGASFDCASGGELTRVAALELPQGMTFYAGPGKRDAELAQALAQGARVQAEGWEDQSSRSPNAAGRASGNL